MCKKIYIYSMLFFTSWGAVWGNENLIMLFLQQYPNVEKPNISNEKIEKYTRKLKQPRYIHEKILQHHFSSGVAGVFGLYEGFSSVSNEYGEIIFPRMQQSSTLNLIVTKHITPMYMIAPATIHHWTVKNPKEAVYYTCHFSYDQESNAYIANIEKTDPHPNNAVPLHTVVLISNPKHVYIPEGVTIQQYSPHLLVPPLYIKKGYKSVQNALYTLTIKQYFETSQHAYKQNKNSTTMMLKN